ncbi:aspartate/glutamate racemase family protein [Nocardia vaccinii]|uniref:aspartate/glutamate racemase family protein n=1 Tax=Nocardia vaccinii TaxID=1822 RepID=UPI001C3FD6FF|nr:amino acid racemase [Nocardia vaccinii]
MPGTESRPLRSCQSPPTRTEASSPRKSSALIQYKTDQLQPWAVSEGASQPHNLHGVGLLGTAFTMEQDFYRSRLTENGLEVLVPDAEGRGTVHRIIYEELCQGVIRDQSRAAYQIVIADLVAHGAEGVILGCTEIELLIGPDDSPVPVFATTRLHAEAAVAAALGAADQ